MSGFYAETVDQIWSPDGFRYEVAEDADGLGLTELRYIEGTDKVCERMTFAEGALPLLIEALQRRLKVSGAASLRPSSPAQ